MELENMPAGQSKKDELEFARFLAQIGHEIRTPLNAIKGFGELLVEEQVGTLNPIQKKYLSKMNDSAQSLLLIVNQILDWAKLESNQIPLQIESVNLCDLASEIGNLMELGLNRKQITYMVEAQGSTAVYGDRGRIREVMLNLLNNAVKFTDMGGSITVSFEEKEQFIVMHMQDTGCGIPKDMQTKIFEPFFTTKELGKGTGLGLAIVAQVVEDHQGKILVESKPGRGTSFTVILPRAHRLPGE